MDQALNGLDAKSFQLKLPGKYPTVLCLCSPLDPMGRRFSYLSTHLPYKCTYLTRIQ